MLQYFFSRRICCNMKIMREKLVVRQQKKRYKNGRIKKKTGQKKETEMKQRKKMEEERC